MKWKLLENYQDKPRRATSRSGTLLPGSEWLAPFMDVSPKTIQKHVDDILALGGEFIRDLHSDSSLRKKPVEQILLQMIEYGGPLLYHGGEDQQRSFDVHLPGVPAAPQRADSLTLAVTHKFSRRGRFKGT